MPPVLGPAVAPPRPGAPQSPAAPAPLAAPPREPPFRDAAGSGLAGPGLAGPTPPEPVPPRQTVSPPTINRPSLVPDPPQGKMPRPPFMPDRPGLRAATALPGAGPSAPLAGDAPQVGSGSRSVVPSPAVLAALKAAVQSSGKVDVGRPMPSLGASLAPIPPIPPLPSAAPPAAAPAASPLAAKAKAIGGGLFASRRKAAAPGLAQALAPALAQAPLPATPASAPAKARDKGPFALFGAGRPDIAPVGGKPKFLGLILTAFLLICLAVVAAWGALSESGLAGLWRSDPPAADVAPAPPSASETLLDLMPAAEPGADPAGTVPLTAPESPAQPDPGPTETPDPAPVDPAPAEPVAPAEEPVIAAAPEVPEGSLATPPVGVAGDVLSPAEAERFYAATGVWLRAPRLPLLPQPDALGPLDVAATDPPLTRPEVAPLPALAVAAPDSTLPVQIDPPAPDTTFARDARGFILATEAGTLTPDGMLIYAGSPPVVPPSRTRTEAPAAVATEPPPAADEGLVTLPATGPEEAPVDEVLSTAGAVALDGLRPPVRPSDLAADLAADLAPPAEAEAAALVSFAGPRPPLRPEGLAPEALAEEPVPEEVLPEEIAEAPPEEPDVQAALAAIVAAAPDPLANATPQAVAQATRPDARPQNFDRVVEQAQTRIARSQTAAAASTVPEDGEPVAVASASVAVAPTGPVPTSVATAATLENAINLRDVNLIGVYGRAADRRALVRLGNGRYVRVGVGDSLDGGQVASIGDNSLNYIKRGRTVTLEIPSG
jgi:hypothetical protein